MMSPGHGSFLLRLGRESKSFKGFDYHKSMSRKVDWTEAKTEYVTGDISYREIAEKNGVSLSTVGKVAKKEGWSAARAKHRESVHKKAVRKAETKQARLLAKEIKLLNKIEKHLDKALSDDVQFNRHIVSEGTGEGVSVTEERIFDKTDMRALRDAMSIAREAEKMRRSLFGYLTESERQQLEMARKKLDLEARRTDAVLPSADKTVSIKFSDEAEEWGD